MTDLLSIQHSSWQHTKHNKSPWDTTLTWEIVNLCIFMYKILTDIIYVVCSLSWTNLNTDNAQWNLYWNAWAMFSTFFYTYILQKVCDLVPENIIFFFNLAMLAFRLTKSFNSHSCRGVLDTILCDKVCQWLVLVVLSGYSGLLHQWNWVPQYSWNIVNAIRDNDSIMNFDLLQKKKC